MDSTAVKQEIQRYHVDMSLKVRLLTMPTFRTVAKKTWEIITTFAQAIMLFSKHFLLPSPTKAKVVFFTKCRLEMEGKA